nr:probable S-adenosylmethionine-dependent methyltransferase At5g37990 [Quercus suber]POE51927.1 putative s-adenosylmethionine-dependent methyltransferase at5g37990 [Quercus suber]
MAMNGGEGPDSYVQNSTYQRGIVEAAIEKINEAIANHFDINALSISPNPICIADLGCSTGPNTFRAMQNIVEAIKLKYISKGGNSKIPDFIVFFNDQVSNDFNTLFKSLPPNRQYFVAGVPGSFHGVLFPKASLHFIHSSSAVHWLSNIPMDVMDEGSPAWNKGRIFYTNAPKEVKDAYATQFAKDMESILFARAQKLLSGGLLALFLSGIPDVMSNSDSHTGIEIDMIGSCLMDMAKVGLVNEAKVDTFNFPLYFPTPKELKALVERSEYFSFERMAILKNQKKHVTLQSPSMRALFLRAPFEGLLEKQFGNEIMDELFDRYTEKVARSSFFLNPEIDKTIELFVLLKRKI